MRLLRLAVVAILLVIFLAVSAILARAFSAGSVERAMLHELVHAEARGDVAGALAQTAGCRGDRACETRVRAAVRRTQGSGEVQVLNIAGDTRLAAVGGTHVVRVAWRVGSALPVVQCVTVQRSGTLVAGFSAHARAIRAIGRTAAC